MAKMIQDSRRNQLGKVLLTACASLLITGLAYAQDSKKSYTRVVKKSEAQITKLQTAQASFRKPGDDREIILYGVIHIADKRYYKKIQGDLDGYDVVLWEGVKPGTKKNSKPGISSALGKTLDMRKYMIEILDLESQGKHINVRKPNFVWADVSMDKVNEGFARRAPQIPGFAFPLIQQFYQLLGTGLKYGSPFIVKFLNENPELKYQVKSSMAEGITGNPDAKQLTFMKALDDVILNDRNDAVMKVLHKQLAITKGKKKTIAIFYGAAHMPDFEKRLADMGYKRVKKSWNTAWLVQGPKAKRMKKYGRKTKKMMRLKKTSKSRNKRAKLY